MLPLAYDDLPPGSDIRRERDGDIVRIIVPAGEPPRAVRRQTLRDALARGAVESIGLLLVALGAFYLGVRAQRISGGLLRVAWGFFAIFCTALVMLVVWVRFGVMSDAVRAGRRQATVIAATPARLLIETTAPFAVAGYDLPAERIREIRIARSRLVDDLGQRRAVNHLSLHLSGGRSIVLLPGRERADLAAVASLLRQSLRKPQEVRPA